MTQDQAKNLFNEMIKAAREELVNFTVNTDINIEKKADKSLVTECDKFIDNKLTAIAKEHGLQVVSEEGEHVLDIVKSGNYITIDPIDGTLGYIDHVNSAIENGDIKSFLNDMGSLHDFSLLLGIVEDSEPKFGACFNYSTGEKIFLDAEGYFERFNSSRDYPFKNAVYVDQRPGDEIETKLKSMPDVEIINQATLGLKSLYTFLNPHESAVTVHRVQSAGLWDILPAAVAAKIFGGKVYDDNGDELVFDKYILLPGKGATIIKGEKFKFIIEDLKKIPNKL